ncbi:TlpA family protein disulfide reductase [Thermodesulfobacteriota bacterium]
MKHMNPFRSLLLFLSLTTLLIVGGCREQFEYSRSFATVDKPAPDFTLQDTEGKTWQLTDLRGKVVFVNFWATWCPPCREEMPSMGALAKSLSQEPFIMITVLSNDNPAMAKKFLQKINVSLPVLVDTEDRASRAYGVTGIPETFIIGPDGILRNKIVGGRDWDSPVARGMIREYMTTN